MFMPPGSTVIEFSWSEKKWYPFFSHLRSYDIEYLSQNVKDVRVNWQAYELKFRKGTPCSVEDRELLIKSEPIRRDNDNIWKWADISVSLDEFKNTLSKIKKS